MPGDIRINAFLDTSRRLDVKRRAAGCDDVAIAACAVESVEGELALFTFVEGDSFFRGIFEGCVARYVAA